MSGPVTYTTTQAIEAWEVTADNLDAVADWCGGRPGTIEQVVDLRAEADRIVTAQVGDYVVRGCTGHFFAIDAKTLAEHYTRAEP